ncbi:TSUP family transporter, partial [Klebsiella pneumoniae]
VGTGSSLIMLPVLVATYGPRIAVPVMAIASLFGNIGRVIVWWHEIRWRPLFAYSLAGVPAAVLGAHTLLT